MWQSGAEGGSYLARFAAPYSPLLMILPLQGWRSAVCRGRGRAKRRVDAAHAQIPARAA